MTFRVTVTLSPGMVKAAANRLPVLSVVVTVLPESFVTVQPRNNDPAASLSGTAASVTVCPFSAQ